MKNWINWLSDLDNQVTFTIDIQEIIELKSVILNFLCDPNSGIFILNEFPVYTSEDGEDYQLSGERMNDKPSVRGEPYLVPFEVDLESINARYVKFVVDTFGKIPEGYLFTGTNSWMFIDEILVQ